MFLGFRVLRVFRVWSLGFLGFRVLGFRAWASGGSGERRREEGNGNYFLGLAQWRGMKE